MHCVAKGIKDRLQERGLACDGFLSANDSGKSSVIVQPGLYIDLMQPPADNLWTFRIVAGWHVTRLQPSWSMDRLHRVMQELMILQSDFPALTVDTSVIDDQQQRAA